MININDYNRDDLIASCLIEAANVMNEGTIKDDIKDLKDFKNTIIRKFKEKKAKRAQKKINESKPSIKPLTDDDIKIIKPKIKELFNETQKYVARYKSDSNFHEKIDKYIRESISYYYADIEDEVELESLAKEVNVVCNRFEEGRYNNNIYYGLTIEVLDGSQDGRIILNNVVYDIADAVKNIAKDIFKDMQYHYDISTGDGDEGCVYISIMK